MKKGYKILIVVFVLVLAFLIGTFTSPVVREIIVNKSVTEAQLFYSDVLVNGIKDMSVIEDNDTISFATVMKKKGEKYILDYEIKNRSKYFSATVNVKCTKGNEYIKVVNEFDTTKEMKALEVRKGQLTLELIKQNAEPEEKSFEVECTIKEVTKEK